MGPGVAAAGNARPHTDPPLITASAAKAFIGPQAFRLRLHSLHSGYWPPEVDRVPSTANAGVSAWYFWSIAAAVADRKVAAMRYSMATLFRLQTLLLPALLSALGGWAEVVTKPVRTFGLGDVQQLAISSDGRHLATAGPAGAFLWDREAGTVRHRFEEHGWRVSAIAFSPDSEVLVSASDDRLIRAWDVESGTARGTFAGHQGEILDLAFAPDGRSFASASADNTARIWALESGELLQTLEVRGAFMHAAVFTPEGDGLVTAATAPTDRIRLWDLGSGATIRTFDTPAWHVPALGFVRGGHLVSAGDDLQVRVWDLETGELVRALSGATLAMVELIASPDLPTVTVGCSDGRVIQWDAETGEVRHELTSPFLAALDEIPGEGRIMTAGTDNLLREWDLETGSNQRTMPGHSTSLTLGVAFSPGGSQVLSGGGEAAVRLWDRATGELLRTFKGHGGGTATVAFSADGSRVLTTRGAPQPMAQLWNAQTGELERDFAWPTGWPLCAALSKDGEHLVTGAQDGRVRLWDVATGQVLQNLPGPAAWVTAVAISPDQTRLAAGGSTARPQVNLWELPTGRLLHTFELEAGSVKALAFSGDGRELLAGWEDGYLRRFDVATGELRQALAVPAAFLNAAVYSPRGEFILVGEGWPFFTARLLDVETGETLRVFAGHKAPVDSVAFDATGTRVLTGSEVVRLWDVTDLTSRLRVKRTDEGLELAWNDGTLEQAASVTGPWEPVPEASSPWHVGIGAPSGFYRVVAPLAGRRPGSSRSAPGP